MAGSPRRSKTASAAAQSLTVIIDCARSRSDISTPSRSCAMPVSVCPSPLTTTPLARVELAGVDAPEQLDQHRQLEHRRHHRRGVGVDRDRGVAAKVDGVQRPGRACARERPADLLDRRHDSGPEDGRGA